MRFYIIRHAIIKSIVHAKSTGQISHEKNLNEALTRLRSYSYIGENGFLTEENLNIIIGSKLIYDTKNTYGTYFIPNPAVYISHQDVAGTFSSHPTTVHPEFILGAKYDEAFNVESVLMVKLTSTNNYTEELCAGTKINEIIPSNQVNKMKVNHPIIFEKLNLDLSSKNYRSPLL
jgi:hypothetical protein